jgi:glutamate synthase (NADPH) large chain
MGRVDVSGDMTRFDAIRLRQLISNHLHYTGSSIAKRILSDWDNYLPKFVKIMPIDYRRALTEMEARHRRPPQLTKQPIRKVSKHG